MSFESMGDPQREESVKRVNQQQEQDAARRASIDGMKASLPLHRAHLRRAWAWTVISALHGSSAAEETLKGASDEDVRERSQPGLRKLQAHPEEIGPHGADGRDEAAIDLPG